MLGLEEEDNCPLVGGEDEHELKKQPIEGFVKIIQRKYSLTNVTYTSPSFGGRERKDPVLATTYSDEWVRHYKEQDYGMIDPTITIGARSSLPVDIATLPLTSKKARRLFEEVEDAGIGKQGLAIPLRGPTNGLWALMVAMSDDRAPEWELRREELTKELLFVAHQVVCPLKSGPP